MKKYILSFALLAFSSPSWANSSTADELHLQTSLELYLQHGLIGGLDSVNAELAAKKVELNITSDSGEKLDLTQAKQHLADAGCVTLTCTFPNGRIKVIQMSPAPSSEVVNAVRKTYEGFGASVTTAR